MLCCVPCDMQLTCGANVLANGKVCRPRRAGFCEEDALCRNTHPLCPDNPLKTDVQFVSARRHSLPSSMQLR